MSVQYNWGAAFVAYCNNHTLQEISDSLGIPFASLNAKANAERWQALRGQLPLATNDALPVARSTQAEVGPKDPFEQGRSVVPTPKLPVALQARLEQLTANRQKNFEQANKLRKSLDLLLENLVTGKLQMEQLYHNKGSVVRTKREISPADLVNIATFARLVHEMTYRALGDTTTEGKESGKGQEGTPSNAPAIIINLPGAIAQPRQQRAILAEAKKAGAKIIDVPSVVAQEIASSTPDSSSMASSISQNPSISPDGETEFTPQDTQQATPQVNQAGVFPHRDGVTQTEIPQPGGPTDFQPETELTEEWQDEDLV